MTPAQQASDSPDKDLNQQLAQHSLAHSWGPGMSAGIKDQRAQSSMWIQDKIQNNVVMKERSWLPLFLFQQCHPLLSHQQVSTHIFLFFLLEFISLLFIYWTVHKCQLCHYICESLPLTSGMTKVQIDVNNGLAVKEANHWDSLKSHWIFGVFQNITLSK